MKKEQWMIAAKRADFNALSRELNISPILARLIRNRDILDADGMREYLHGSLKDIPDPFLLKAVKKGAQIIRRKIESGKKIRIISDYDVDGVSSNYILYLGLKRCGADVDYRIPDRVEDGYGINEHLISQAFEEGVDTIITCDNGIAAGPQIARGNERGMTFVITDHHDVPYEELADEEGNMKKKELLPEAAAVINPKQEACSYPHKNICGAVVALKFVQVLYHTFGISVQEAEGFLEIAALATVCDVMPLTGENRIIVKEGLRRMNSGRRGRDFSMRSSWGQDRQEGPQRNRQGTQTDPIPGLQALIEGNHLEDKEIKAWHLGFIIGPCINASGRLSTARLALELLLCRDPVRCREMAEKLIALNTERKEMTKKGEEDARAWLEESGHDKDKVLVVYLPECHESIAGIIAGRIREEYNKPVFVLTRTLKGVKGSGRSIEAYHMFDEMTKVRECFDQYGGHPMAAGLSMQEDRIEELREKLNSNTSLTEEDFIEKVHIDIALPVNYLSEALILELDRMEPFGTENRKPLFAQKGLYIAGLREAGTSGRVIRLYLKDAEGYPVEAVYFGDAGEFCRQAEAVCGSREYLRMREGQKHHVLMDCTYYPEINVWKDRRNIQIIIKNYRFRLK